MDRGTGSRYRSAMNGEWPEGSEWEGVNTEMKLTNDFLSLFSYINDTLPRTT